METVNAKILLDGFLSASRLITEKQNLLNSLNYFPVADKDTGTNMALSISKSASDISSNSYNSPKELYESICDCMFQYGHGNSGTILTLFFEGFCQALPEKEELTGAELAKAFQTGAMYAEEGVDRPKDGTILSVARSAAAAGLSASEMTSDASFIWQAITTELHAALSTTALKNPILKDIGIADSGAFGFCLINDGFYEAICPDTEPVSYDQRFLTPVSSEGLKTTPPDLTFPFCTELVMENVATSEIFTLESFLRPLGDCLLMVRKDSRIKLHIHTASPDMVILEAGKYGHIISEKIDDMRMA